MTYWNLPQDVDPKLEAFYGGYLKGITEAFSDSDFDHDIEESDLEWYYLDSIVADCKMFLELAGELVNLDNAAQIGGMFLDSRFCEQYLKALPTSELQSIAGQFEPTEPQGFIK